MSAPLKTKNKRKLRTKLPRECAQCGATENLTIDHIRPRCFGGTNGQHNLQTLCARCNIRKSHLEQPRRSRPTEDPTMRSKRWLKRKAWFSRQSKPGHSAPL
ncbi:HNH endonuclease [Hymenobacter artigasi]|uniref:HNH endonuclease n=1 Tax=Hymenobacter artigasi TaxID=2719616 RepID=UPI001446E32F